MLSFKMAIRSIASNKLRAILTMLGIIIGVMALVVLVSLVNGATSSVTDAVSSLGSSMLTVTVSDNKGQPITLETVNEWMETEDEIGLIAPYLSASATAEYDGTGGSMTVYGVTSSYYDVQCLQLVMGRWLKTTDVENHSYVCVINETAATELIGYVDCLGMSITLDGVAYTIVGVLSDDEDSLTSMVSSGSLLACIPYTSLFRLSDSVTSEVTEFYVSAPENATLETAQTAMTELLMDRFEDDDDAFEISSQSVLEETMSSITTAPVTMLRCWP